VSCWISGSPPSSSTIPSAASRSGKRAARHAADPAGGVQRRRRSCGTTREKDLADLIYRFGEERFSRRIARAVVERRKREPIRTTTVLAELVSLAIPRRAWPRISIPPQGVPGVADLRERGAFFLAAFLDAVPRHLSPGPGAVISFHSLEDRLVKSAFRRHAAGGKKRRPWNG